jgi:DNA end-binding protein Ku
MEHPVAPRAYWKGYLHLSLVACPIQLFPATSERTKIRLHQINRKTGNRIRYCKRDAVTGEEVDDDDIVMAYEVSKGHYIEIEEDELEALALDSTHTVEIDRFVPRQPIGDLYLNRPYYITPDGKVGRQAYAVIRAAMEKQGVVALGRVIFTTREHVIAIEPHGKGLLGLTLRHPYEIRDERDFFADLPDEKIPQDMLDLATHIIASKEAPFDPGKFEDHYERALKELIKRKQRGEAIEKPKERAPPRMTDLLDALRRSAAEPAKRTEATRRRKATRPRRASAKRSSACAPKAS